MHFHPEEPSLERRLPAKARQPLVGAKERILGQILRCGDAATHQAARDADGALSLRPNQAPESLLRTLGHPEFR